ncbi:hypothetical protein NQ176_g3389 [Zarea fungicola]|uniref:Uncharacterized protein n=1 Tax=Zarea fungicola TaxID=93591 RepID=A0ACC1NJH4_9HYPO|nr:hypothetical protein NQ176_g3389 [Lecanicillium fungicola]
MSFKNIKSNGKTLRGRRRMEEPAENPSIIGCKISFNNMIFPKDHVAVSGMATQVTQTSNGDTIAFFASDVMVSPHAKPHRQKRTPQIVHSAASSRKKTLKKFEDIKNSNTGVATKQERQYDIVNKN